MMKKAFTMVELMIAIAVVAVLALVTIPLAKNKMDKVDNFSYYLAYATVQDIAANIVAQTQYNFDLANYASLPDTLDTVKTLCDKVKTDYNISNSNCDVSAAQMTTNTAAGFKDVTPHLKLSNGLNIYINSDLIKIAALSDANPVSDRIGYLVDIDVNGSKGKGILYQDVFPFYILMTGKVLPLYNPAGLGGANNVEHISGNILYDSYNAAGNRSVKASQTKVTFQTGACATGFIQSTSYCQAIAADAHCSDSNADCRFIINKPMKFFGR